MKGEFIGIVATVGVAVASVLSTRDNSKLNIATVKDSKDSSSIVGFKHHIDSIKLKNDKGIIGLKLKYKASRKDVDKKLKEIQKLRYDFQDIEYPIQLQSNEKAH